MRNSLRQWVFFYDKSFSTFCFSKFWNTITRLIDEKGKKYPKKSVIYSKLKPNQSIKDSMLKIFATVILKYLLAINEPKDKVPQTIRRNLMIKALMP